MRYVDYGQDFGHVGVFFSRGNERRFDFMIQPIQTIFVFSLIYELNVLLVDNNSYIHFIIFLFYFRYRKIFC